MKMHISVDESRGLIHRDSLTTTSANVHDITQADQLLHGNEERVWDDAGYRGIEQREEHTGRDVDWLMPSDLASGRNWPSPIRWLPWKNPRPV